MTNTERELFELFYDNKKLGKALWELIEIFRKIDQDRIDKWLKPITQRDKKPIS